MIPMASIRASEPRRTKRRLTAYEARELERFVELAKTAPLEQVMRLLERIEAGKLYYRPAFVSRLRDAVIRVVNTRLSCVNKEVARRS